VVVKILKYEFSNFWWDFKVASLLAWPGYLPNTLLDIALALRIVNRSVLINKAL
jgi:hypothetical protein